MTTSDFDIQKQFETMRPGDKIVKILNNRFLIADVISTTGTFTKGFIFHFRNGAFYALGRTHYIKHTIDKWENYPNIERTMWCFDHSANGKPYHYLPKVIDNRKIKQIYRQLHQALKTSNNYLS